MNQRTARYKLYKENILFGMHGTPGFSMVAGFNRHWLSCRVLWSVQTLPWLTAYQLLPSFTSLCLFQQSNIYSLASCYSTAQMTRTDSQSEVKKGFTNVHFKQNRITVANRAKPKIKSAANLWRPFTDESIEWDYCKSVNQFDKSSW